MHGQPGNGARRGQSLFDRIPWRVVIPAGMQLAQELREAVRDYARAKHEPPPTGSGPQNQSNLSPQLHDLQRRLDRLETHHEQLGRLLDRLGDQEAQRNQALQRLATRVAVLLALCGVGLVLAVVAMVLAVAN